MAKWVRGTVVENTRWTNNLFTLRITADIKPFTAGQFASLALDIDGERIARPYSFLSGPQEKVLEFFFYTATGGVLSNALFALEPGETVWVKEQPNGFFTLDEVPPSRDLWMIGTGTGIAPYLSILSTQRPWETYENIILIQAVRTSADLCYRDRIDNHTNRYSGQFTYQAFVSREEVPGCLPGRIPAAFESGVLEQSVGHELDVNHSQIMLCGNPDMVKDMTELLKARGFTKNRRRTPGHITTENYW